MKLRPCPFCDNKSLEVTEDKTHNPPIFIQIICLRCNTRMARMNSPEGRVDIARIWNREEEGVCRWVPEAEPNDWNAYDSECGGSFQLVEGDPADNDMEFCPFCGLRISLEEVK